MTDDQLEDLRRTIDEWVDDADDVTDRGLAAALRKLAAEYAGSR